MTRLQRNANIGAVIVPFVAVLAAIPLLWNQLVGPADLVIMVASTWPAPSASRSASTGC